jgi:TPR repeat protein
VTEFRRAAEEGEGGGYAPAQSSLGECYYQGHGVEKDDVQARGWFKKALGFRQAAENRDGDAQNELGCMYHKGEGVEQNDTQAVAWFVKSGANGFPAGQSNLARCHLNGSGVERDVFEAGRLFRFAALQGYAAAQWQLGEIFRKGELYCGVKMKLARTYFNLAADQGYPEAVA